MNMFGPIPVLGLDKSRPEWSLKKFKTRFGDYRWKSLSECFINQLLVSGKPSYKERFEFSNITNSLKYSLLLGINKEGINKGINKEGLRLELPNK